MSNLSFCFTSSAPALSRSSMLGRSLAVDVHPKKLSVASRVSMTTAERGKKVSAEGRFDGEYAPVVGSPTRIPRNLDDVFAIEKETATGPIESPCGGSWDAQNVEQYDGTLGVSREFVDEKEAPVGALRWRYDIQYRYKNPGNVAGERWCTGTMVSPDMFFTAGHCFDFRDKGGWVFPKYDDGSPIPDSELARELTVEMNFQTDPDGNLRDKITYPVEAIVEKELGGGMDFGILRVGLTNGKLPGDVFGTTPVSDVDAEIGDMCCIIGHPAGRPKAIEAGPIDDKTDLRLRYGDIDTLGGNSGSGILREASSDIVGVHTNGGCTATGGFNSGMKISAVLERSPTLRRIAQETTWESLKQIPGWYGWHNQGGDIAFGKISSDKATDLIAMHIDNPEGENSAYYRIGKDVTMHRYGHLMFIGSWTDPIKVPGWFGHETAGAGVAFGNIKSETSKDLIIFHIDDPEGENHGYYRIGYGIDTDGIATEGWSEVIQVPGWFGHQNHGGGIALGGIRSASSNDLVVMHLDNPQESNAAYYRVGFDLGPDGKARGGWSDVMKVPGWFGWENQGGGVALFDIDGNGKLDIVVFHIDNPRGDNRGYYRIGYDLDQNGQVTGGWSTVKEVPGWFGWESAGGGVAVHEFDKMYPTSPRYLTLATFHIDNPEGENHGYVRFGNGTLM